MGLFKWINDGIEARNARAKVHREQEAARRHQQALEAEKRREEEDRQRADAAVAHLQNVIALFEDKSNQASIPVKSFFAMFDKPHKVKVPYVDRFAGEHSGVQTQNAGAAIGSILSAGSTAYRRTSLEFGMENFEIARYVYDLDPKEVAMLKIVNFLHAMGRVSDAGYHGVTCAILFNGGDCILRPGRHEKTGEALKVTNVDEMACKACLRDNMPSAKAAFDPVFQIAVQEWKKAQASGESGPLSEKLLGEPLTVIMT